jgi:O-antigen/teichoic acid export membrane protein
VVLLPVVGVHLSPSEQALFGLLGGSLLAPYFLNAALNAYGFTTLATAIDAAGSLAQLGLVLILFWQGTTAVDPYVGALVAGNVVQVGLGLVAVRRQGIDLRPRCRRRPWRLLVRTGLPGIALDVGQVLTFKIDRYLLGAMLSPAAVGVYSVAATAPELLRLPTLALSQPIFHRLASGSARIADFRRTRRLSLAVTAVLTAATFFVAPFAVKLLFGDRFAAAVTPLRVLLLAEFGITVFYLDASSLAAGMHRVGDAGVAALAGFAVVALSDLLLIPSYGIAGAAWASVIAYTVMGLVAHLLLRHRTGGERLLSPEGSTGPVPGTVIEEPSG